MTVLLAWMRRNVREKAFCVQTTCRSLFGRAGIERMQLEFAKEDFKAFGLQQNSAGGRKDAAALVDFLAVGKDCDAVAIADAFDAVPLAKRPLDVVLAVRVEQFLEIPIVL